MRLRTPTAPRPSRLLHQRPPRRGSRRHPRAARPRTRRRCAAALGVDRLGLGLWLPAPVRAPAWPRTGAELARLRAELDARGLEVVTLNAFPYGGFHDEVVKHARVPARTGPTPRRLRYTLNCARCWPTCCRTTRPTAAISTLPLAWREPWTPARRTRGAGSARRAGARSGDAAAGGPAAPIRRRTRAGAGLRRGDHGRRRRLRCRGRRRPRRHRRLPGHLPPGRRLRGPGRGGAAIGEPGCRSSSARCRRRCRPRDPGDAGVRAALAEFAEPRFLHQVRELGDARDGRRCAPTTCPRRWPAGACPAARPVAGPLPRPLHAAPAAAAHAPPPATCADAGRPGRRRRTADAPPGGGDLHLVRCCPPAPAPHRRRLADGIAAELRWRRARRPASSSASNGAADEEPREPLSSSTSSG